MNKEHFSVYNHSLVYGNNQIAVRKFIVLEHTDGTKTFTNFHRYSANPNRKIKSFNSDGDKRCTYICKLLNYAFFSVGISSLSELTVAIGQEFLQSYAMCQLPEDDDYTRRSESTIKLCVDYILDFYTNLILDKHSGCNIRPDELYRTVSARNRYGKVVRKKVPLFDVSFSPSYKAPIFRDMPNKAFHLLFDHIVMHHKDILGLVLNQAFAGLRPSEACNVRRPDSPLGAGIIFSEINGELYKIEIDLRNELNLRSDLINVGGIKRERMARVPDIFLSAYKETYDIYADYMKDKVYERDYGALSVNKQGKTITYQSYYNKFRDIINEIIPIYLDHEDPELVLYGQTLMTHSLSPHVFRHWYTVQLVLSGIDNPGVLMHFRGDRSPESSAVYIQSKGDLEKQFSRINNETFDYIRWAAKKEHDA